MNNVDDLPTTPSFVPVPGYIMEDYFDPFTIFDDCERCYQKELKIKLLENQVKYMEKVIKVKE